MSFRSRTAITYDTIKQIGKQSLNSLAKLTGASKSSVHRQQRTINARSSCPGADFFETTSGQTWLHKLFIALILVFGICSNVGAERLTLFCQLIGISDFVAISSSTFRRMKNEIQNNMELYQQELTPKIQELSKGKELIAGADETFFNNLMVLVLMDLPSGFIFLEEMACNRTHSTWLRLSSFGISKFKKVHCLVSDRAKAIIKLSKSFGCRSIADFFHFQQDITRFLGGALKRKLSSLEKNKEELDKKRHVDNKDNNFNIKSDQAAVALQSAKDGYVSYQREKQIISTFVHPFTLSSKEKTTKMVGAFLKTRIDFIERIAQRNDINDKDKYVNKLRNQVGPVSELIDFWWAWAKSDLLNLTQDLKTKDWVLHFLLPCEYWRAQIRKSKYSSTLVKTYKASLKKAEENFINHKLTKQNISQEWSAWAKKMVSRYQRSTSAIEGRNGALSQSNHCLRGLEEKSLKSKTIVHNFFIKRLDGTTAAERMFGFKPPDLFSWLVQNTKELPLPRKRKPKTAGSLVDLSFSDVKAA